MPCTVINSYLEKKEGNTTITRGNSSHGSVGGLFSYNEDYSAGAYFIPAEDLTDIPDGVSINKIAFEYTNLQSNTTYTVTNLQGFIYLYPSSDIGGLFNRFPNELKCSGRPTNNGRYDDGIVKYTDFLNGVSYYSFTQGASDPSQRYVDIPFVNSMTYKTDHAIAIAMINNSEDALSPYPEWIGDTANHTGAFFFLRTKTSTIGLENFNVKVNSFKPNVKIYWN